MLTSLSAFVLALSHFQLKYIQINHYFKQIFLKFEFIFDIWLNFCQIIDNTYRLYPRYDLNSTVKNPKTTLFYFQT